MKTAVGVVFLLLAGLVAVNSLPRPQDGSEDVVVPADPGSSSSESSEESGEDEGFFHFRVIPPFFNSFENLWSSLAKRLHDLMSSGPSPDWGTVTNATSTKKVIDGHVVTINDTTYTKEGNDSDSVLFVRVVNIEPTDLSDATVNPEAESIEGGNSDASNEVSPAQTEERAELLERREYFPDSNYDYDVDNAIDVFETKPISLEGDLRVNKVRQDQTKGGIFMVPHDVEVFDVEDGKPVYSYNPYHPSQIGQKTERIYT